MKPWRSSLLLLLVLLLAACQQEDKPLPTTAPRIPTLTRTPTITASPSLTPFPGTLPPTADVNQPTWTPSHTLTPRPSNTPFPTRTPVSTSVPTQAASSTEVLSDGLIRVHLFENDVNAALEDLNTTLEIEPDEILLNIGLLNTFLGATSQIRARVSVNVEDNRLVLTLLDFTSEGPQVTRTRVQDEIATVADALNGYIQTEFPAGNMLTIQDVKLSPDFIVIDINP